MNKRKVAILGILALSCACLCANLLAAIVRLLGPILDALDAGEPWAVAMVIVGAFLVVVVALARERT